MRWLIILLPLILLAIPVHATTTNFTYAYDLADADVANGTYSDTNFGTQPSMSIQTYAAFNARSYMMWNSSAVPNSTINNATLYLYFYSTNTGDTKYVDVYNTSLAWNETNLTWNTRANETTLISNNSMTGSKNRYVKFDVTTALQHAVFKGIPMSIMLKLDDEVTKSFGRAFYTKESGINQPILEINYTVIDCTNSCGNCGCDMNHDCAYPQPLIDVGATAGAFAINGTNTIACYPNLVCENQTSYTCPNGTLATQVSPVYNFSDSVFTPVNNSWCAGCWFINFPHLGGGYSIVGTNCYDTDGGIKYECECNGIYCANVFVTSNNTTATTVHIIPEWTAGCFNPTSGKYSTVINSSCNVTTIENLTKQYCPDCNITTNQSQMSTCSNTTTNCYDSACNPVSCGVIVPSSCASNTGGQLALSLGGLMGITDCGLSQNILAILTSIIIGFAIMFYTKDSEHSGQAFIFGTISMLVMFTLIGWFASWLMVLLIVIGAYLVAKSLGVGSG